MDVQLRKSKSLLFLELYCNVKRLYCSSNVKFWIIYHHLLVNWRHVALYGLPTRGEARTAGQIWLPEVMRMLYKDFIDNSLNQFTTESTRQCFLTIVEESSSSISENRRVLSLAKEEVYSRLCKEEILQILYCSMKKSNEERMCL